MARAETKIIREVDEMQEAIRLIRAEGGPKCEAFFNLSGQSLGVSIYPKGILDHETICKSSTDWREALAAARAEFASRAQMHAEQTTQALASAIIRITFETGACSDAQLRGADFDAADVARFGQLAVERANAMADKGPFVLTITPAANDAETA